MSTNQTVRMFAPTGGGGVIQAPNGTYTVASDGTVTINAADVPSFLALGYQFAQNDARIYTTPGAPVAANASVSISTASLTNGSLAIAAQPDVCRQVAAVIFPGSVGITAGTLTVTYTANDGTTQVDALSLVAASQSAGAAGSTVGTTKGVLRLTSAVVSGLTGGQSPGIYAGTNNYLGVPVPPRFVDWALTAEKKITPTVGTLGLTVPSDETISTTVIATGALVSPTQAPDGTHGLSFGYTVTYP